MNIGISRKGLDKVLSGNITNEKYASAFNIPALIENSAKVSEADYNKPYGNEKSGIHKYHYFENDFDIGDKNYKAHIRVRTTDLGEKYYGHTVSNKTSGVVENIKIEPLKRTSTGKPALQLENESNSIYNNSILSNSQKSNTSDENISNGALIRGATTKSEKYQSASEKFFTDDISKIFGVPKTASKNTIAPIVSEISEAVKTGQNNPAKMDELFNKAYEAGVVTIDDYYNQSAIRKIAYPEGYMGGKHNLGFNALEMLPEQLNDPLASSSNAKQHFSPVI